MDRKAKIFALSLSAVLLLCALVSFSAVVHPRTSSSVVTIYQDGQLFRRIDLSKVETPYTIELTSDSGSQNIIEVKKDSLCMLHADCPDKICVSQGDIASSKLPIVCLPNRIVIEPENSADAVTY